MVVFPKKFYKKLVRVTWYDIICGAGWMSSTANLAPAKVESIGWVSSITKIPGLGEVITLSASTGQTEERTEDWNQHMTIPVVNITKVLALD